MVPAPRACTRPEGGLLPTVSGRWAGPGLGRHSSIASKNKTSPPRHLLRARDSRDLASEDFFVTDADRPPVPPPLAVALAGGARLWEADLPTFWDIAAGTPARMDVGTPEDPLDEDDEDNLDWAAGVGDWPRFWALYAAWKFHLDVRRLNPPRKDARAAPGKRPDATWERTLRLSPPDGPDAPAMHPLAAQKLAELHKLDDARKVLRSTKKGKAGEKDAGVAAAGAAALPVPPAAAAAAAGEEGGAPGDKAAPSAPPTESGRAKATSPLAAAAREFWDDDFVFEHAIDKAVRIVHRQLPSLLAAGVPVPELMPAYDFERTAFTIFQDDPREAAWESRWRLPRDAIARPPPPDPVSPFAGWAGEEMTAWARKRAAHDVADAAYAISQTRVGMFIEADIGEHSDIRMRRAVDSVPGFKFDWTHEEIMGVITNGGISVHPDAAADGLGISAPNSLPDYWEEGIHQPPPLEEYLDGLGRLAGPGTRGPPQLADPDAWGVGGPDGMDGAGGMFPAGISPTLAAEAAAAVAAVPDSISGMRRSSGGTRGGGGVPATPSSSSDPLASDAASATLDEPFADFELGVSLDEGVSTPTLDPAAESRPAGYEDEDGDGE